jgi:hypothetical protein
MGRIIKLSPTAVTHERAPAPMELTAVNCALGIGRRNRSRVSVMVRRHREEEQWPSKHCQPSQSPDAEHQLLSSTGRGVFEFEKQLRRAASRGFYTARAAPLQQLLDPNSWRSRRTWRWDYGYARSAFETFENAAFELLQCNIFR